MMELQILGIIVIIVGIIFMIAEIFVPSFGITGSIGFFAMTLGIIMTAKTIQQGLLFFVIMLFASIIFLVLGYRFIANSKLTLKDNLKEDIKQDYSNLIGVEGIALTPLRPAGKIEVSGQQLDALTQSEFISKNDKIRVVAFKNNNIFVGRA